MKLAVCIMLILSSAVSLSAQGSNLHLLSGVVVDQTGAVISGASLQIEDSTGRVLQTSKTDETGTFHLKVERAGAYSLVFQQEGFRSSTLTIQVKNVALTTTRVVMQIASQNQSIVVGTSDTPPVSAEIADNQSANTVDRSELDHLPVFDMDYIGTLSRFLSDDATGTNGVSLVVNGLEANGPGVSPSAIKNVKINQNPYSALFSRPGRGRIEITTSEGTPVYHGSLNFLFRDSLFDTRNAFATTKPVERRTFFEGSVTGPLGHAKKNTFLLSGEDDRDDQQATVVAVDLNGSVNETVATPIHHSLAAARIFHDYGGGNQLWVSYSYERETSKNQGVGGTVLPEAGTNIKSFEHEVNTGYTNVISPHLLNQLHGMVGYNDNPVSSTSEAPSVTVQGAFTGGGAQLDTRRTEAHFAGTDIVTYSEGVHELKFGVDVPDISRRGFDDYRYIGGAYSFGSLSEYAASAPSSYTVQQGQGHVTFLEKSVSGFLEDTVRVRTNFSLAAGLRYYWQNYFHDIPYNVAPRLSMAYSPGSRGGTVLRAGAGVFYDRSGPRAISDLLHFDGHHLVKFIDVTPTFPETAGKVSELPPGFTQLDPGARIPYQILYSAGVERQLTSKSTLAINYNGSRGIDQFRSVDVNAPLGPTYGTRPNPKFGQIRQMQSDGYLKNNSLEITFRGRPSKYFSGQAQYTLGKTYNNTSGINYFLAYSYSPSSDWSRSDNDRRNKFDMLGTIKGSKYFDLGVALSLYSGKPVDVTTGNDENNDGLPLDRPAGTPRNSLHGPGTADLDLNLTHEFSFHKRKESGQTLAVSINSFDVFNHPNYLTYVGVATSPFFDQPVQANPGRRMQLNVEYKF